MGEPRTRAEREHWPRDPVCGLQVNPDDVDSWVEYGGTQYFFCCPECQKVFEEQPEEYAGPEEAKPQERHSESERTRHSQLL